MPLKTEDNISDVPKPGANCPPPEKLETGDLLFPRRLNGSAINRSPPPELMSTPPAPSGNSSAAESTTVRNLLERNRDIGLPTRKDYEAMNLAFMPDITRLRAPEGDGSGLAVMYTASSKGSHKKANDFTSLLVDPYDLLHSVHTTQPQSSIPDMSPWELDQWIVQILEIALHPIPDRWLGLSVKEFRKSKVWSFLQEALLNPDARLAFFIGHTGIVLKEGGNTWVIEANITDYSHYRVSIHPYYVNANEGANGFQPPNMPDQALTPEQRAKNNSATQRGWVNRRTALGELVWWARPTSITEKDRRELPDLAKRYLGRPFGFFDHPDFRHENRFYCAEFVARVFNDVRADLAKSVDDQRTWNGMINSLKASGEHKQAKFVDDTRLELGFDQNHPFFVLPPALLWRSRGLERFSPTMANEVEYA